jgi:hypothetical protein
MKTSNILLLSLLGAIVLSIAVTIIVAKVQLSSAISKPLSGVVLEEERNVGPFEKISVNNGINVYYTQDSTTKVTVKADTSIVSQVETIVNAGELKIAINGNTFGHYEIDVFVTSPTITEIDVEGGGSFSSVNQLAINTLEADVSAGAKLNLDGNFINLDLEGSAGSVSTLKGQCDMLRLSASAGSIIGAGDLLATTANVNASSGAVIDINVTGDIDVSASSGAVINCSGNPRVGKMDVSSGAVFKK